MLGSAAGPPFGRLASEPRFGKFMAGFPGYRRERRLEPLPPLGRLRPPLTDDL
jgi:hypothetical protein